MKIIFTICSNNYLAQAKALGDSVLEHNPKYKFVICLCDKKSSKVDYSVYHSFEIIETHNLGIEKFDQMVSQYDIIELNTSIKPFSFDYLFKRYKDAELVMYFDPDTYVFDKLTSIEEELKDNSILLTPHIYTPIEFDGKNPTENTFTKYGIYNLGFIALKRSENAQQLIDWWKRRLEVNCYISPNDGIFVDQLPMNFTPIFFNNVKVSGNWGLNMAPWNLHERNLTFKDKKYYVNNKYPLVFYHFSNCDPNNSDLLATYYTRLTFEGHEVLKNAYDDYKRKIINNNYNKLSKVNCFYLKQKSMFNKKNDLVTFKKIIEYLKKYPFFVFRKNFWN